MSKWKLRKLEINSFKVFEEFSESFDNDLTVLDGPNGFGKTSVFDALQLLLCGEIPRIIALYNSLKGNKKKHYERNLYWNNKSQSSIKIKAEFYCSDETICLMKMANLKELTDKKNHQPLNFNIFKLYELSSFDELESANLIEDEQSYIKNVFGPDFLSNFSVLNYISQDNNSVIVPDTNNKTSRFDQISHLIKLDEVNEKLVGLRDLESSRKKRIKALEGDISIVNGHIDTLTLAIKKDSPQVDYKRISTSITIPQWDKEAPVISTKKEDYEELLKEVALLDNAKVQVDEIELRLNNNQYNELVAKPEFTLAIYLGNHFSKHDELVKEKSTIDSYKSQIKLLKTSEETVTLKQLDKLTLVFNDLITKIKIKISERIKLKSTTDGHIAKLTEIDQLRLSIIEKQQEHEVECLLCGFDYTTNQLLIDALELKSKSIIEVIERHDKSYKVCLDALKSLLKAEGEKLTTQLKLLELNFNLSLLEELEENKLKKSNIELITQKLTTYGISLPLEYSSDDQIKEQRLKDIKVKVLSLRKIESDSLQSGVMGFFNECFKAINELKSINITDVQNKSLYINSQYNLKINSELSSQKLIVKAHEKAKNNLNKLGSKLTKLIETTNRVKNTYSSETIGQVESLFHIYSGRLIQNYQRGLGLFIDTEESSTNKTKNLHFFTADGSSYDAVLSMSSGQVAALTLAFFLSLNRKYAQTAFILIDDPTQSMDEINIASLSDLLRVELRDRQVIISTHEQEVSDYLRYRYLRGGLKANSIHLQNKYSESLIEK
jgi:exonuclease SbcC